MKKSEKDDACRAQAESSVTDTATLPVFLVCLFSFKIVEFSPSVEKKYEGKH